MNAARTSAQVRDAMTVARTKFEQVRAAYLADEATRDDFQDADHAVFLLERELRHVEEREQRAAALEADKAQREADRQARIAEAAERELHIGPWRKMLDEALAAYQSKSSVDRDDLKAIVEGKLAEDRIRERSLALWAEHEQIQMLREKVGDPRMGDTPPTVDILLEQFGRAVDHALLSESVTEAHAGGVDRVSLEMAIELIAECGGPDRRVRAPEDVNDPEVAALADARRDVIEKEHAAAALRQRWYEAPVRSNAWRQLQEQLQAAQTAAEMARHDVEQRTQALRARGIDAALVAPAAPPVERAHAPAPRTSTPGMPERAAQLFKDRFSRLMTGTSAQGE